MTRMQQVAENAAVYGIWTGIVLILLTPFVVTPDTIFPFVVGKAVYSRSLIECMFGIWAILALFRPAYRPPRSRLLLLLAVSVGVSILAACFGVSPQRSFWSTYERMQGVVDLIHWFAFAVVLASVLRTERDWRIVLNLNLGAGLVLSAIAICLYYSVVIPFFDYAYNYWGENRQAGIDPNGRVTATLGNALYLGMYGVLNSLIAVGFLVQSFILVTLASPGDPLILERMGQKRAFLQNKERPLLTLWIKRGFWVSSLLTGFWAINLTGSRGALISLLAGAGFLAVAVVLSGQTRLARFVAIGSLGFLVCVGTLTVLTTFRPIFSPANGAFGMLKPIATLVDMFPSPLLRRLIIPEKNDGDKISPSQQRTQVWNIGLRGLTERPLLGWGPDNFLIVFGRYASEHMKDAEIHDQAHNKFVEEAVTKGILGLLSYLIVWIYTLLIIVRVARSINIRDQILFLFVCTAMTAYFIQSQFNIDNSVASLYYILLLVFVIQLEPAKEKLLAGRMLRTSFPRSGVRAAVASGIIILVGVGLFANHALYSAACNMRRAAILFDTPSRSISYLKQATTQFEPLANTAWNFLFYNGQQFWKILHTRHKVEGERFLALIEDGTATVLATEPENWIIYSNLAATYRAVAVHNPEHADAARRYSERALELAPHRIEATLAVQ